MSTEIIHSISVERDPRNPSVFLEKTSYSSSNVWNYGNKSRPRHEDVKRFSDSENGNLAMFCNGKSWARAFLSGCCKGFGVSKDLNPVQVFSRFVNRANRAGMSVPSIVDPNDVAYRAGKNYDTPFPALCCSEIRCALRERNTPEKSGSFKSIEVPETFQSGYELATWAKEKGFVQFSLKAIEIASDKKVTLRFFIKDGAAYQFRRRSSTRGYYFSGKGYRFLGVAKVSKWLPAC